MSASSSAVTSDPSSTINRHAANDVATDRHMEGSDTYEARDQRQENDRLPVDDEAGDMDVEDRTSTAMELEMEMQYRQERDRSRSPQSEGESIDTSILSL